MDQNSLHELSYRIPMPVVQARVFKFGGRYPVCPKCGISFEREYQRFCDRCGQLLDWSDYKRAQLIDSDHTHI